MERDEGIKGGGLTTPVFVINTVERVNHQPQVSVSIALVIISVLESLGQRENKNKNIKQN